MGEGARPGVSGEGGSPTSKAGGLVETLRPRQWYKQAVIFLGIVFSGKAFMPAVLADVAAGAALWCLVAGSVYIVNDVLDREEDRAHPEKRHRPIASGRVGVPLALATAAILSGLSFALAWLLSPLFTLFLGIYAVQNLAYSAALKGVLFVDLIVIGLGFVWRAVGGVVLAKAAMSPWLVLTTFLAALLLGAGKRDAEIRHVEAVGQTRETSHGYERWVLDYMLISIASTLLVAYSLYTFFARGAAMMATLPFAYYAVFRFGFLVARHDMQDPSRMFADVPMVANFLLWLLTAVAVIYVLPPASFGLS